MMKHKSLIAMALGLTFAFNVPAVSFAAENDESAALDEPDFYGAIASSEEIDAQIKEQRALLNRLKNKKKEAEKSTNTASHSRIRKLEEKIKTLEASKQEEERTDFSNAVRVKELEAKIKTLENQKRNEKIKASESSEAMERLMKQIEEMQLRLNEQTRTQFLLDRALSTLDSLEEQSRAGSYERLVNPAPSEDKVSYTQDAINAQNNSTMVFRYAPDQLYKIYCRTGFLTDIALHEGETVKFVGGGDTSAWAINSSTVGKVPHIYIKPIVETSTTNVIITTDRRSYQLIVCTSDWYNPMVRWTYGAEAAAEAFRRQQIDEMNVEANAVSVADLHFGYRVKAVGNVEKPDMVFDDGKKTIIQIKRKNGRIPALFIRERGHKSLTLTNFKLKGDKFVLDQVIDYAELRYGNNDYVVIKRKSV